MYSSNALGISEAVVSFEAYASLYRTVLLV